MYRASSYNIYLYEKQKCYILHGTTGALSCFEKDKIDVIKSCEMTYGDYLKIFDREVFNNMLKRGFVTAKTEVEEMEQHRSISMLLDKGKKFYSVVIVVTHDCNFRCPYCFENGSVSCSSESRKKAITPKEVDRIFKCIEKALSEGKEIKNVTLFGGEPLLKENVEIVDYIAHKAQKYNIEISAVTNGYDLDSYFYLIENKLISHLEMTLDGIKDVNNVRRVHKDRFDTFEKITKNIDYILKNTHARIDLISNLDDMSASKIEPLIEFYKNMGWLSNEKFSYYFRSLHACYERNPVQKVNEHIVAKQKADDLKVNHFYEHARINMRLERLFKEKKMPYYSPTYCGASGSILGFDMDGNVYPCWEAAGRKELSVGFLKEDGEIVFNEYFEVWKNRKTYNMEKCNACAYALICRGGCPMHAIVNTGEIDNPECGNYKEMINDVLLYNIRKMQ